jgi:8-amino-7-oxononanoate synthase
MTLEKSVAKEFPDVPESSLTDLVRIVRQRAQTMPDMEILNYLVDGEDEEIRLTFAELDAWARAIACRLTERGMSGRRALLLYPPGIDFIAGLFGCIYAGVVAVPIYPPRRNRNFDRIQAIAIDARAVAALTVKQVTGGLDRFAAASPALNRMDWITTDEIKTPVDPAEIDWYPEEARPDELAVLQYTSGSTGRPKGVMLTHQNILSNCRMITRGFGIESSDIGMSWLPTYHDMGLVGGIINPIYAGIPSIHMSPMAFLHRPVRWLRAITKHGVTITGGPNFAFDICTKKVADDEMAGLDLSRWKLAYNGAENIRPSTLERFVEKFGRVGFDAKTFYPCYGMAEATLIITGGDRNHSPVTVGFDGDSLDEGRVRRPMKRENERLLVGSGRVLPGEAVIIVDPNNQEQLPPERIGEIWVHGPSVGQGYLDKPELTDETFKARLAIDDGRSYLRTGDMGFFHEGQLFVTGRIKDLIIIRGVNRYPQDIEMTVERADTRLRTGASAAFSIMIEGDEKLIVISEVERLRDQNWTEVIRAIRKSVAEEHDVNPDGVVLIRTGSIPKTSSGKIQRHACRDGFLKRDLVVIADWYEWQPEGSTPQSWTRRKRPWSRPITRPDQLPIVVPVESNGHADPTAAPSGLNVELANGKVASARKESSQQFLAAAIQAVQEVARDRVERPSAETNIVELGLDSLERIEIASRMEKACGVVFPEQMLFEIETCQDLADAVADLQTPRAPTIASHRIEESAEYQQLKRTMSAMDAAGIQNPYFRVHEQVTKDTTVIGGRELVNFSSYNYLGLSGDAEVSRAAQLAIEKFGTSVSASRVASGEKPIHRELEQEIAELVGTEDAIVFVGGHSTNETTIGHLLGASDLVLHDSLAHNSIIQGCLLSGATRRAFAHNDYHELARLLKMYRQDHRRVLIVIEGVYSMDGDIPNLPKFVALRNQYDAMLMVDEAHSIGTLGATGRGIAEHFGIDPAGVDLWMGTLSKSFASCGGYIGARREIVEYLRYSAPGFVYSVGISPANAGAALAAIRKMNRCPEIVSRCRERSEQFLREARSRELDTGNSAGTPVVPVITGSSRKALLLSQHLFEQGYNVQPILYPAVEEEAARLRFFITSDHTESQITSVVAMTAAWLRSNASGRLRWDNATEGLPTNANGATMSSKSRGNRADKNAQ